MRNLPPPPKIAQALVLTSFTASVMFAAPAQAADCSKTTTVSVPYEWSLTKNGDHTNASVIAENKGQYSTLPGEGKPSFIGSYLVKLIFSPLTNICEQLTPTPTENILGVTGRFSGILKTNYTTIVIEGIPHLGIPPSNKIFAHAEASFTLSPGSTTTFKEENLTEYGQTTILQELPQMVNVKNNSVIGVTGRVKSDAYTGTNFIGWAYSYASAELSVTDGLFGQNSGTVDYLVPEPEPEPEPEPVPLEIDSLSVIGSTVLFGLGLWGKRKLPQKQINKEEKNKNL